jgi:hypothetical protein
MHDKQLSLEVREDTIIVTIPGSNGTIVYN